jgi:hypothetical protein
MNQAGTLSGAKLSGAIGFVRLCSGTNAGTETIGERGGGDVIPLSIKSNLRLEASRPADEKQHVFDGMRMRRVSVDGDAVLLISHDEGHWFNLQHYVRSFPYNRAP